MKKIKFTGFNINLNKYEKLLYFFAFILIILWIRLFYLEVVKSDDYNNLLISQHYNISSLEPERGNIFLEDENGKSIQLTENINLYQLYADPYIIWDSNKVSSLLSPILYKHFCVRYKLDKIDKLECIKNIEKFSGKTLLKEQIQEQTLLTGDLKNTKFEKEKIDTSYITTGILENTIKEKLTSLIQKSYITKAYIGFFPDDKILKKLKNANIDGLEINNNYYVYINIDDINNKDRVITQLHNILSPVNNKITIKFLERILNKRPKRYVKIVDNMNPIWINEIKKLKKEFENTKENKVPLLHGIGFKKQPYRFYPYGTLLSHVIGYINGKNGVGGIEEYYNDILKGKEGKIIGMSTPWIGKIGSSSLNIQQAQNGSNIYLTIDYSLQKTVEEIIKKYYYDLRADDISVVILDPFNGEVKALAGYPNFDPNNWKDIYKIKPLNSKYRYLVEGDFATSYIDIPILIETGGKLKLATFDERFDPKKKKYIFKNLLGPRTFINQIIAAPYEPGSIFKVITEAIAIDTKDISLYDYYTDKGIIKVGIYRITNVAKECKGYNTFLHALERSCNVGMVKIVLKVGKDVYYNYLKQLGFGKRTGIQLANEARGKISALEKFSQARFFNNSFGQGILVTPMQMAVSYATMVNGGYLLKPTIVKKIENKNSIVNFGRYVIDKIFAARVSKDIIYALYSTIYQGDLINLAIKGYTIGGKTGTSQIAFKGKYQKGIGWTIGSFVGIVTKDNLKYVIAVKVSRPRTCQWGLCTAGYIFKDIAKYIIKYKGITK